MMNNNLQMAVQISSAAFYCVIICGNERLF